MNLKNDARFRARREEVALALGVRLSRGEKTRTYELISQFDFIYNYMYIYQLIHSLV